MLILLAYRACSFHTCSMPRLTESQLRFQLLRGFQSLPRSVLRDMVGKSPDTRERALSLAVDVLMVRFQGMEVSEPEPVRRDWGDLKN
jgi:hypothetical protein